MESFAVYPEGEFDSLNRMLANIDELDFTQQLHMFSFPLENNEGFNFINPSNFCPDIEADGFNENINHIVDWFPPTFPSIAMEDTTLTVIERDQIDHSSDQNRKKRHRVSTYAPSSKKHREIKVNANGAGSDSNIGSDSFSCSRTSSLEDDNVSEDTNNRKTRASRGLATDPQSTYARKRRERINERLRILQNLVPNGTKVDISTMLEEAVQYVKFLQLQVKLLSSDDLWMYAPIAYNGIDIGLDTKI